VDADPDAQRDPFGPGVLGEGSLCRDGRVDGLPRPVEGDEERVAVGVELASPAGGPGVAQQPLVVSHDCRVAVAQRAQERRRALDVREEEGESRGPGFVHGHAVGSFA
jgi:hypothetical protein